MNHRTLLLTLVLGPIAIAKAQYTPPDGTGLEGIIVETYYVADTNDAADTDGSSGGLTVGARTYRVFADMKPGYELLTVGGFTDHPISFSTTTTFFNNEDRGEAWGDAIGHTHLDENTVAIDSWLAMGAASDAHWGVPKAEDTDGSIVGGANNDGGSNAVPEGLLANSAPGVGIPLTTADGLLTQGTPPGTNYVGIPPDLFDSGGSTYSSDNFAWAVLGGVQGPTAENKVLIGQFTTDGVFSFCLNLWVRIPDSLVCDDPNCHTYLEYYGNLLESDTAGTSYSGDNKFTLPSLCFDSSQQPLDCQGVPGGSAGPGTPCDDGNADTQNDVYDQSCACVGEDCLGVLGGNALPGEPCDDGDPNTSGDTWQTGCVCMGSTGIQEHHAATVSVHPNPTRDLVRIDVSGLSGDRMTVDVRNAMGQRVVHNEAGVQSGAWRGDVDLSAFQAGVYFVEITIGSEVHMQRITKF